MALRFRGKISKTLPPNQAQKDYTFVANGEAERFVRTLKRYILATSVEGFNWKTQIPHFLRQYSATLHSTKKKKNPFEACTGRKMNIVLLDTPKDPAPRPIHDRIAGKDSKGNEIMKWYADRNKKTKPSPLCLGGQVLIKQKRQNKLFPPYNPKQYTVTKKKGSMLTVQRGNHQVTRNSFLFKRVGLNVSHKEEEDSESESD